MKLVQHGKVLDVELVDVSYLCLELIKIQNVRKVGGNGSFC